MPKKILIIEDDETISDVIRLWLEEEGYRVKARLNGDGLKRLIKTFIPDLILVDHLLPGKNGVTIVRELRADEETRRIPIVMITAGRHIEKRALAAGVNIFITKPFDIYKVLDAMKQLLA